jgi:16S rRNA (cytosine967-C5)-methyltransferase
VNTFLATRDEVKKSLAKDDIETADTPFSPWGLRVDGKVFLSKSKAFAKGWIDIQDEGSQLIAHMCGVKPGLQVLDFCAGAGGKTLALASAMMRKGRIVAMDTEERRLEKGKERFKRAKISDIIEVRPLTDERHRKWLRRQKETFDVVLLDVPCTGTGTWRRNPDMRWRNYGPGLEELKAVQQDILEKACGAVKKGGRLVYATCSLLPDENEEQVAAFLEKHPEFSVQPPDDPKLGAPYMRLTPLRHATDGFFAAILLKN